MHGSGVGGKGRGGVGAVPVVRARNNGVPVSFFVRGKPLDGAVAARQVDEYYAEFARFAAGPEGDDGEATMTAEGISRCVSALFLCWYACGGGGDDGGVARLRNNLTPLRLFDHRLTPAQALASG